MSKLYFTKYLPVEGEIKEGDTFLYKGLCFVDDGDIKPIEGRNKIKLFLCSRDIKVGDKVIRDDKSIKGWNNEDGDIEQNLSINSEYEVEWEFDKICTLKGFIPHVRKEKIYKVIGEISSDALSYVTEGMEFSFGKVDKNGYLCPYNKENEEYIKFWTERGFRDLPDI